MSLRDEARRPDEAYFTRLLSDVGTNNNIGERAMEHYKTGPENRHKNNQTHKLNNKIIAYTKTAKSSMYADFDRGGWKALLKNRYFIIIVSTMVVIILLSNDSEENSTPKMTDANEYYEQNSMNANNYSDTGDGSTIDFINSLDASLERIKNMTPEEAERENQKLEARAGSERAKASWNIQESARQVHDSKVHRIEMDNIISTGTP